MKRAPIKTLPSQRKLLEIFRYDKKIGRLFWNKRATLQPLDKRFNAIWGGKEAGSVSPTRYCVIKINNIKYYAHRIIWKIVTGSDCCQIDHIDGDKWNNRISNLRDVSQAQNRWNMGLLRNNTSGYRGVFFHIKDKKWYAVLITNGKRQHLGQFNNAEEAHAVVTDAIHATRDKFARV